MIKIENLSKEEIKELGIRVGETFYDEKEGIATTLPKDDALKAFEIMTECYHKAHVLYATSEKMEGLLAYWRKKEKIPLKHLLHMIFRMLKEMRFKSLIKLARNSDNLYEKVYRKEKDYVIISLVVIFPEYQGKGYLRKILDQPFKEAKEADIPCVLDTDTELKEKKYVSCGMKAVARKKLKSGHLMRTMEYR